AAAVGDDGQFGRKAGDVALLLLDEAAGNQERKGGIDVAGGFEALVERGGDVLPEGPAVGADDHAAADGRVIGQFGAEDELVVPFGKVFGSGGKLQVRHSTRVLLLSRRGCGATRRKIARGR